MQAKNVLVSGNKITALLTEENSKVKYGEEIKICIYLTYEKEQKDGITIGNVTLNGNKLVEKKQEEIVKEDSDTNLENKVSQNTNTNTEKVTNEKVDNKVDNNSNKHNNI